MYLKSIEVQGFKSFANKIRFEFHNGITAIVGPNGSGKSNVADAVRWVLGEQRAKSLRGSSMQDVIFAGTEQRKPQSYAYVAITLDNTDHALAVDYEEVTVARRLYRSGESEYLFNGSPCRLKDIQELFFDTGIGKEGYSIIGQGQIERILSDKPEDRRMLFDEAAGIVKFKHRKEASLRKLEDAQANRVRISDILSELEKQVGPLEEQAKKARIYLDAREELKVLDVNVFLRENEGQRARIGELAEKADAAGSDLSGARDRLENIRAEYETIEGRITDLEQDIEATRNKITDTDIVRGRLEGDIKVCEERIRAASSNLDHFMTRKEALSDQIAAQETEAARIGERKKQIDEEAEKLDLKRDEAAGALKEITDRIAGLSAASDEARETILELLNKRAQIKSRQAAMETLESETRIKIAELTSRLLSIRTDESRQDERIEALEAEFARITGEITKAQEEQSETERGIASAKTALTEQNDKLQEARRAYLQDSSKLESLRNLTERYEGFGGAVRRVMEEKKKESGLLGVIADLFRTEPEYETAVEIALGANIQNIVTKDEECARRMIELLKKEKGGRATFMPLTTTNNPQEFKNREVLKEKGVIGLADQLVTTRAEYRDIAATLLGRIVIVDTFDHAAAITRKYKAVVRMVTLEGEMFAPGGSISGGAFRNSSNLLGSRRELSLLQEKVEQEKKQVEEAEQAIEDVKASRNALRMKLEETKLSLQQLFIRQNTARVNVTLEKEKKEEYSGSLEALKDENESLEKKLKDLEAEKKQVAEDLLESERLEKENSEIVERSDQALSGIRSEEEEKSAALGKLDVEIGRIRQEVQYTGENLERVRADGERLAAELSEVTESISSAEEEIADKQKNIEAITKTIETSHTVQAEDDEHLKKAQAQKEELNGSRKKLIDAREELTETISALDKELYRLTTQKENLEAALEKQINYMWEEYEITLSDAEALKTDDDTPLSQMKKSISSLKNKIRGLGSVNVNAIEEYREVSERYTFLKTQHDDLVEAEKKLTEIISTLDSSMRKQFAEQFEKIRKEFDTVFKVLFGGGEGRLELVEDEDILEAGVRVIAQPPGKKLVNMMQLSGGEKSLTAIALLFAIQNLKPSPFCLLDEIEASLDENNVVRFSDYLHKLTANTQFIVITHRRGTMERADRLYGITMQEKGISTLVSVNLIDKEITE